MGLERLILMSLLNRPNPPTLTDALAAEIDARDAIAIMGELPDLESERELWLALTRVTDGIAALVRTEELPRRVAILLYEAIAAGGGQ